MAYNFMGAYSVVLDDSGRVASTLDQLGAKARTVIDDNDPR